MSPLSLLLPLFSALLPGGAAYAAQPDVAAVYGGGAPDADAEKEARRVTGSAEPALWFLEPLPPVQPGTWVLGSADVIPCDEATVPMEAFEAAAAAALQSLDEILPDEASARFEAAASMLPCLELPPAPDALAAFQFNRGIAALTRADRDQALGLAAFVAAITADPDTPWNEDYPALPRSVFFEGKVAQLNAPRAQVWLLPEADTRVWFEGNELNSSGEGNRVLVGRHLVHIQQGDNHWRGQLDLPPGAELVIGPAAQAWEALLSDADAQAAARAFTVRRAVGAAFQRRVLLTRPGAFATMGADGALGSWSDEGAWRPRLAFELGGDWRYYERHIEVPPVDIPNPGDLWAGPHLGVVVRFHPIFSAHIGGGLGWSGPFELQGEQLWRLMASGKLGVGAELPKGPVRPGAFVDLGLLLPGEMTVAGEPTDVVLLGPVAGATLALRLTELLWLQLRAQGGWIGSTTASAGLDLQLRLPPLNRYAALRDDVLPPG